MTRRRFWAVLPLVLAFGLGGCAPSVTPSVAPPSSAAPTPSPEPEWTIAYDADCANVLSEAELADVLGPRAMEYSAWWVATAAARTQGEPGLGPEVPPGAEGTAGGLRCTWVSDRDSEWGGESLPVFVLPEQTAAPVTVRALAETACDWSYDTRVCRLGATGNGVWALASAMVSEDAAPPTDRLMAAAQAAIANAADLTPGVPSVVEDDRWEIVDCEDLGSRMDLAAVLGADFWSGYWEGTRQHEDDLYEHAGVQQFCQYGTNPESAGDAFYIVSVTSQPGAAWRWAQEADRGGESPVVAGASDARRHLFTSEYGHTTDRVRATDGVNIVLINVEGGDIAPDIAERAFAAFG